MPPSSMNDLFQFLTELLTTYSDTFQALGLNLFRGFALILIVWFGAKSALSSASGGPGFHFDHFAQLILTIAFGFAMITYYSQPVPGIGISFHKLFWGWFKAFLQYSFYPVVANAYLFVLVTCSSIWWTRIRPHTTAQPLLCYLRRCCSC